MKRMDRPQFFGKLAALEEERLKKALWNLYWRGTASMRERIEAELDPQPDRPKRQAKEPVLPKLVLSEVRDFVALARCGAYMGGDRRVSPRERTRWRFTFQRLVGDARAALQGEDVGDAAAAMEELIDLACQMKDHEYFRSEDPVEAARFVVSDAVALLWSRLRDQYGFSGFAERAAPQLMRWESRHGWTRRGDGSVSEKEVSLAGLLAQMLPALDACIGFADYYLDALDRFARDSAVQPKRSWGSDTYAREQRTAALAEWHLLLLDKLAESEAEDRLDRLTDHAALGGPELVFLRARLAHQRGDVARARDLMHENLQRLPGHQQFLDFATAIGAPLPPHAQRIAEERARFAKLGGPHSTRSPR
jgi:uncharacterized protein YfiM (DUF2279 family)